MLDTKVNQQMAINYTKAIWEDKNLRAIDEFLDEKCIIHSVFGNLHGKEAMKRVVRCWMIGFPDLKLTELTTITEEELVVVHWKSQGTHLGEFKNYQPTGKKVTYAGVTIYRIIDQKIVEYWAYTDMQNLLNQLS